MNPSNPTSAPAPATVPAPVTITPIVLGPQSFALQIDSTLPDIKTDTEPAYLGKFSAEQERAIMEMLHQSMGGNPSSGTLRK
jgi:hypothetical protein